MGQNELLIISSACRYYC